MKAEELLNDESFLAWYYRTDQVSVDLWETRKNSSPEVRGIMDEAVILLMVRDIKEEEPSDEKLISERNRLMAAIDQEEKKIISLPGYRWLRWMAAACLLFIVGTWVVFNQSQQPIMDYYTSANEIREITLPDGSVVSLNQQSHLKLLNVWAEGDSIREVWLDGEAYFSVQHTKDNSKFIVHSGEIKVEVLGTTFNVKKQSQKTIVVLETGKVQLSSNRKPEEKLIMQEGQMAEYTGGELTKKSVNTQVFTAWKEGKIIFENASLSEVARRLEDNYGLEVDISALSDADGQFNGSFPADDLDVLLAALSKAYSWQIDRDEQKVTVSPEHNK